MLTDKMERGVNICILGAGIIGSSTAICLQNAILKAGQQDLVTLTVMADKFSPDTTSDGSGGFWEPFTLGDTSVEKIRKWGDVTFKHLYSLYKSSLAAEVGVTKVFGYSLEKQEFPEAPFWNKSTLGFRRMTMEEVQSFSTNSRSGFAFTTMVVQCTRYLPWLLKKFEERGGKILKRKVMKIDELADSFDLIINCTGLGSYWLLADKELYPVRGQVIKVRAPWIKNFTTDNKTDPLVYILPGPDTITLGGTTERDKWDTSIAEEQTRRDIWENCCKLEPSLAKAEIIENWVGLRPARSSVRIEKEKMLSPSTSKKAQKVIHNYGHGGAGVTIHWGCALDAAALAMDDIRELIVQKRYPPRNSQL